MAILTVGVGQTYVTLAAAVAASASGDTIEVQAGTYVNDFNTIEHPLTIVGVGGLAHFVASVPPPNGKAIMTVNADLTIDGLEFSGAAVADQNGAGIRYESGNLVIRNSWFHDNENGLLSAPSPTGTITIEHSEFNNNGAGDGYSHNLYVGDIATLTITNSYFHDVKVGHEIKSRAETTIITDNAIADGPTSTASYSIDLPNGGQALIRGNVIEKGPNAENSTFISVGEEGPVHPGTRVDILGNTFISDLSPSTTPYALRLPADGVVNLTGNTLYGFNPASFQAGASTVDANVFPSSARPAIDTAHPYLAPPSGLPCYCRGTHLLTEHGEVAVEDLAIGDWLITHSLPDGRAARAVRWIGRRRYDGRFAAHNRDVLPVCIYAGALAENVPHRDLWVSPLHALYLNGALVPAAALVNGISIIRAEGIEQVEYFHLELDCHAVILAEGAPAESFVDDDSRGMFHNAAEYQTLYPDAPTMVARYCAPRLEQGDALEALRMRLAVRAGLGAPATGAMGTLAGNLELADPAWVVGWAHDEAAPDLPVRLRILAGNTVLGEVLANQFRRDLLRAGIGQGRHGFRFAVPAERPPRANQTIRVCRVADGGELPGSPRALGPDLCEA